MARFKIDIETDGNTDVINLSPEVGRRLRDLPQAVGETILHLFVAGSTAALTTLEFEPGLVKHDLPRTLQQIAPDDARYEHEASWHDDNGHAHIRAALIGPSLTLPVAAGRLLTGEWQQVVLIDFDTRPRRRTIICTLIGG